MVPLVLGWERQVDLYMESDWSFPSMVGKKLAQLFKNEGGGKEKYERTPQPKTSIREYHGRKDSEEMREVQLQTPSTFFNQESETKRGRKSAVGRRYVMTGKTSTPGRVLL